MSRVSVNHLYIEQARTHRSTNTNKYKSTKNQFSLQGRVALVTGGARGCGLAFAQGLAEAGAAIAIFDILVDTQEGGSEGASSSSFSSSAPPPAVAQLATDHGVRAQYYHVDVTSPTSLAAGFAQVQADFGPQLDIVVACAGVNQNVALLDTTEAAFDRLFNVNCKGVYFTAQQAARHMMMAAQPGTQGHRRRGGSIILVASMASYIAIRSQRSSAYCGTKGAVKAMVAPMAAELHPYGIRVNSISPGYVRTEMTAPFPHLLEGWKDEVMLGRVAEPEDLKGACVFLASDASSYCTGSDIVVDGGVMKW